MDEVVFCLPCYNGYQWGLGWFLVGLAGQISNQLKRCMPDVGLGFTRHLGNLSTVMSTQGVSQVVGVLEGDSSKFRDWIKSIEKYVLLAGGMLIKQKVGLS